MTENITVYPNEIASDIAGGIQPAWHVVLTTREIIILFNKKHKLLEQLSVSELVKMDCALWVYVFLV
jgi:hypothetical protein